MGVKETIRGLGCMAKGVGCILAIAAIIALVYGIIIGGIVSVVWVAGFIQEHSNFFLPLLGFFVLTAVVGIILWMANAIGKDSD